MSHSAWTALDIVPDPMIVVDEALSPLYLNAAGHDLRAVSRSAATGAGFDSLLGVTAGDASTLEAAARSVIDGALPRFDFECPYRQANEERWSSITIVPARAADLPAALIIHRDVTERASQLRASQSTRARLQKLSDAATDAVCLHEDGVIIDANAAALAVLGYSRSELVGAQVASILSPDVDSDLVSRPAQGSEKVVKATVLRRDGTSFVAEVMSKTFSAEGRTQSLAIRDLTAHRATEQALRDSEERFRLISELSSEGLVLTDKGLILQANAAMTKLFGFAREQLIGMSALNLTAPEDRRVALDHIQTGSEAAYEARGLRNDGTMFLGRINATNLPYQGGFLRGTRIHDISAQRQAESVLCQNIVQQEKLRAQAERLAEMSTPLIPIRHDVMAMPLIGSVDAGRAQQALETMLEGMSRSRAHTAIVDITGVSAVDSSVASSLVRLAQAVRLQGAQVVLTGIRAEVAQTLVALGADLSCIVIKGTLQDGISYAFRRGEHVSLGTEF